MANNTEHQYMQTSEMNAEVYPPYIKVSFHTEKECYQTIADQKNRFGEKLDPKYQLLSVNTQKSLENPAGAFTISLAGTQWMTYLKPMDLVVVQMGYLGEKTLTTVMVGLIDNVRRTRSISGGTPSVNTTVTGRDFGKLLIKSQLKFYPEIGAVDKNDSKFFLTDVGWVTLMSFFTKDEIVKGTPAVVIDNIMRFLLPKLNDVQWKVYNEQGSTPKPKTLTVMDIIRYQLARMDFFLPMIMTADSFEGSLWNLMERASIKPFCELFIDVRDDAEIQSNQPKNRLITTSIEEASSVSKSKLPKDQGWYPFPPFQFGEDGAKVVLTLRETPFDSKDKEELKRHVINQEDVLSEDLAISDEEHFNLFWAGTTVNPLGIDLKRVSPPLINEHDVKRYGISPLEVEIEGLEILQSQQSSHGVALEGMSKTYTAKLKAWYENNHKMWNGTLIIRGRAGIRIGHMVDYHAPNLNMEFYVENVAQSFNVFEGWTTTLQVTRGQKINTKVDHTALLPKPPTPKLSPNPVSNVDKKEQAVKDSYYVVKGGDTLWAIAGAKYGQNTAWRKIWEANKDMLIKRDKRNANDHGHWIFPGQSLRIPPK